MRHGKDKLASRRLSTYAKVIQRSQEQANRQIEASLERAQDE
ncbi:hypothetical protein [Streptomyces beihaiensis]|uniref:Uncharacterized protein n=1 Tax=Streptomyces beihaiensis TaxID=2984495 RepID=A0ABT3U0R6_9ACTN|nr:hypothetical protein [Streptomyces beihaiensis]MCX3062901.1 hypothetical protein [Streptomyces beihaiensis]